MLVWVAIVPDNELLGVFSSKELCQKAIDAYNAVDSTWEGWGSLQPQAVELDKWN